MNYFANKFHKLDEMNKFLERCELLIEGKMANLINPSIKEKECVFKNLPTAKAPVPEGNNGKF